MTQVRLLRVLETGEFMKVGSSQTQRTDVRIVAATNRNLIEAIAQGRFREDLYYRLNTVEISLPPLRGFRGRFFREIQNAAGRLSDDAIAFIQSYDWPGKHPPTAQLYRTTFHHGIQPVRRCRHGRSYLPQHRLRAATCRKKVSDQGSAQRSAGATSGTFGRRTPCGSLRPKKARRFAAGKTIGQTIFQNLVAQAPAALPGPKTEDPLPDAHSLPSIPAEKVIDLGNYEEHPAAEKEEEEPLALEKNEIEMIRKALERHRSKQDAARELGISERTLYRKIKQYGLQ